MPAVRYKQAARAVGYIRVSKVGGREGDSFISPQLQREQIEAVARREGLEIAEVIEELDASGGDASRPGWNRAIEMVERGEVDGIAVWNLARFSRSVKDALSALERIQDAGGNVWSATEDFGDGPSGKMLRTILLAVGEAERDRARATFSAATASAVERGIHVAGKIPLGYARGPDRRLVLDPATAPVVLGLFERRARGWSWTRLARWLADEGHEMSENGVAGLVRNPVYTGQARYGPSKKDDAHQAIVPRSLWRRCQSKALPSARTGKLTEKYLLQGLAVCSACMKSMYLSGSGRRCRNPYYYCRQLSCTSHAYAQAHKLDAYVMNVLDERNNPADPTQWVALPGDDREVDDAVAALADAQADLDGFLADTKLRRILGSDKYAESVADYVAVVNQREDDLADARERNAGGYELVGRLWNTEWGWAERKEWLTRMIVRVVVRRGTEPLSRRAEVELR